MQRSTNRLNRQPVYTTDLIDRDEDFISAHLPYNDKNYSFPSEKPTPVDRFPFYTERQAIWVACIGFLIFLACIVAMPIHR